MACEILSRSRLPTMRPVSEPFRTSARFVKHEWAPGLSRFVFETLYHVASERNQIGHLGINQHFVGANFGDIQKNVNEVPKLFRQSSCDKIIFLLVSQRSTRPSGPLKHSGD